MKNFSLMMLVGLAVVLMGTVAFAGQRSEGAGTVTIVGFGVDLARCGPAPQFFLITQDGTGVDDVTGANTVVQDFCVDLAGAPDFIDIFDFRGATTDVLTGDALFVTSSGWRQLNVDAPDGTPNCVGVPEDGSARFVIIGGTGANEGARGHVDSSYSAPQEGCYGNPAPPTYNWIVSHITVPQN